MLIGDDFSAQTAEPFPNLLREFAFAKLNLFLEIRGKRADGFHEIATLMLAVDLCDELSFAQTADGVLSLSTDVPGLSVGPDNLVMKAAQLVQRSCGTKLGATIHLTKRIPWAAGLGGGSSDAASTIRGLCRLWNVSASVEQQTAWAATLGSDIPFFLNGPAAWCTGRGELISPVPVGRVFDFVLVKPPIGLGTADVYRRLTPPVHVIDGDSALKALADGDVEALGKALHNRLQEPAFAIAPEVADWHRRLSQLNTPGALMSGSGSCLFVLCRHAEEARQVADDLSSGLASLGDTHTRVVHVRSRI